MRDPESLRLQIADLEVEKRAAYNFVLHAKRMETDLSENGFASVPEYAERMETLKGRTRAAKLEYNRKSERLKELINLEYSQSLEDSDEEAETEAEKPEQWGSW